jgi:general secretion pathway protein B
MSFILDALRKSEIERQRQSGPSMAEFPVAREDRRLPFALIAIGFLLAINAAIVLFFMLRDSPAPAASATQVATTPPASVTSPSPVSAAPAPATAPVPQSELLSALNAPGQAAEPPMELYGETATLPPDAPDPTLLPEARVPSPGVTYSEAPPDDAPSVEAASGLPGLTVDLHIFTNDPAKRAIFINGRRYTQGAHIAEGPIIEEITREGAVLSYRGRRFLLPRV